MLQLQYKFGVILVIIRGVWVFVLAQYCSNLYLRAALQSHRLSQVG